MKGPDGGYRLDAGAELPPLLFDDDQAIAIAVALRSAVTAAPGSRRAPIARSRPSARCCPHAAAAGRHLPRRGDPAERTERRAGGAARGSRGAERVVLRFDYGPRRRALRRAEPHAVVGNGRSLVPPGLGPRAGRLADLPGRPDRAPQPRGRPVGAEGGPRWRRGGLRRRPVPRCRRPGPLAVRRRSPARSSGGRDRRNSTRAPSRRSVPAAAGSCSAPGPGRAWPPQMGSSMRTWRWSGADAAAGGLRRARRCASPAPPHHCPCCRTGRPPQRSALLRVGRASRLEQAR